jgi:hypothetical protein
LQLFNSRIDLTPKRDLIKFIEDRSMKPLTNVISLRQPRLGFRMLNIVNGLVFGWGQKLGQHDSVASLE